MSYQKLLLAMLNLVLVVLLMVACSSTATPEASVSQATQATTSVSEVTVGTSTPEPETPKDTPIPVDTHTPVPPTSTPTPIPPTPIPAFPPLSTPGPLVQFGLEWRETHRALAGANWDILIGQYLEKEYEELYSHIETIEVPSEAQKLKTSAISLVDAQIISAKNSSSILSVLNPAFRDYLSEWENFLGKVDTPSADVGRDLGSGHLLFMCNPDGNYEACLMNTNRSEKTVITVSDEAVMMPKMSPSGEQIVFYSNRNDVTDIFVINLDGSDEKNLTAKEGGVDSSWSPDGKQITFASARGGGDNFQIFVMNNDGTNVIQLTDDTKNNRHPQWSPDGKNIIFFSSMNQDDEGNIFLMDVDGSNVNQLTNNNWSIGNISWSPDGKRIAFIASEGENDSEVYVMNADGSDFIQLTDNDTVEVGLTWSPDGVYILYSSAFYFSTDIYIIIADGSSMTPLTDTQTEDEIISDWIP